MKALLSFLLVVSVVHGLPEFYRVVQSPEDDKAILDIMVDLEENYSLVTVGYVEGPKQYKPSVNLHDYTARYKAVKDIHKGECYIHASNHTIDEMTAKIEELLNKNYRNKLNELHWECEEKSNVNIEKVAGPKIAAFCRNYQTFMVTAKPGLGTSKRDVELRTIYRCGTCISASCR